MSRRYTFWIFVCRLLMGGLLLYAGVIKVIDPLQFQNDIMGYQLLPEVMVYPVAICLPWLEILCGLSLWVGYWRGGALFIQIGMMGIFMVGLALAWARGLDISCGCFGHVTDKPQYAWWLVRDLLLVATLTWLLWRESVQPSSKGEM